MTTVPLGDKGQPYEVSFYDPDKKERRVLGWSQSPAGAEALCNSVRLHPRWRDPRVVERVEAAAPPVVVDPEKPVPARRSYE